MPSPDLHTTITGADEWAARADRAVMEGLESAVTEIARLAVADAVATHPYTDRTGNLTASIGPMPVTVDGGVVRGGVEAQMPYARFVEEGTSRMDALPFLGPALARTEADADRIVLDALDTALRGAA
jgi:HK97 gp10 family phage protein